MKFKSGDRWLVISGQGISIQLRRPAVGGGTYVRADLMWPWKKDK